MVAINWNEFKEFKKHRHGQNDNFSELLEFIKSYYNMSNPNDIYETLKNDDLSEMMLEKRDITDAEGLESYLFKVI
jgi:hypothetical protein